MNKVFKNIRILTEEKVIQTPDMRPNDGYHILETAIKERVMSLLKNNQETPVFTTPVENLMETFLENLPEEARQHYNCNACRRFVNNFGGLVLIKDGGNIEPLMWDVKNTPIFFKPSVQAMVDEIKKSKINGIFLSDENTLGTPITGIWSHMSATIPNVMVNKSRLKNAYQLIAEKKENFNTVMNGLKLYSVDTVNRAIELCDSETLYRSDRVIGVAKWFQEVQQMFISVKDSKKRNNLLWYAVATAPQGYCHIRSSMIGTLLDDIENGLSMRVCSARFAEKMSPDSYMRSQSAPTSSAIEQAEKLVEKLGIASALQRRYAKYDEIKKENFLWEDKGIKYQKRESKSTGIFGNITPKQKDNAPIIQNDMPSTIMTWEKFKRTVLPDAQNIEAKISNTNRFMALVTANDPYAENIFQWDNPFSWYYHSGIDGEIKRRVEAAGGQHENVLMRCSLIWNNTTDLDLHCITPSNQHIYWSTRRKSIEYGMLDVDANGCDKETNTPVENIRWINRIPNGHYEFYVHNYRDAAYGKNEYKVELEINGQIFTYCDNAGRSHRKTVFEFDYIDGKILNFKSKNSGIITSNPWNVSSNSFVKVKGIINSPNMWGDSPKKSFGDHIFFLLEDCKDLSKGKGRGFFNEMLKPELHEIRKTLEAYCANSAIEGLEESNCSGLGYNADSEWNLLLRVKTSNGTRLIKIDRFD